MVSHQNEINGAVLELYDLVKSSHDLSKGRFPNELIVAKRTVEGMVVKNGVRTNIGLHRLLRLIEKYAPDAFDIKIQITKK